VPDDSAVSSDATRRPGWYPIDGSPGVERWYDGQAWTFHQRPVGQSAPLIAPAPPLTPPTAVQLPVTIPPIGSVAPKKAANRWGLKTMGVVCGTIGFILVGLVVVAAFAGNGSSSASDGSGDTTVATDTANSADATPDIPAGFIDYGNGLAYKYDSTVKCDEGLGMPCSTLDVYAYQPCDSVYVQANGLDDAGDIVNWTNATTSSLSEGDTAVLKLQFTEDSVRTTRLTQISCN
jgi:hypothetical protein